MTDQPPPFEPAPTAVAQQQEGGSGKKIAVGCGIGCLVVLIVAVVLGVVVFEFGKKALSGTVEEYTSEAPAEIDQPRVEPARAEDAIRRFDQFREEMRDGVPAEPLVLSEADLNALVQEHPSFSGIADSAVVRIEGDLLRSAVSVDLGDLEIPIPFLAALVTDRYFNGEVTLGIDSSSGDPSLFIENVEVGGKALPQQVLNELKKEDLFKEMRSEPEFQKEFQKVEDIRIEGGRLIIVPASGATP